MHPHTIRDAGFWTECWWHAGRSPSSLARRTQHLWFQTRMSNLDSSDHRTLFHFETVHFKRALAHRSRRLFWTMFTYGFLFCIVELYLASSDGMADCVYRQRFLEVFLGPFSNVNDIIMPMSDAVSSVGPKTTVIQQRSFALSLQRFFQFSFYALFHRPESLCPSLFLRDSASLRHPFYS